MPADEEILRTEAGLFFFIYMCVKKIRKGERNSGMDPQVGSILKGKVARSQSLELCHPGGRKIRLYISRRSPTPFVQRVHDFLQEGQEVKVSWSCPRRRGASILSIRKALPSQERPAPRDPGPFTPPRPRPLSSRTGRTRAGGAKAPAPSGDQALRTSSSAFSPPPRGKMADLNQHGRQTGRRRRR